MLVGPTSAKGALSSMAPNPPVKALPPVAGTLRDKALRSLPSKFLIVRFPLGPRTALGRACELAGWKSRRSMWFSIERQIAGTLPPDTIHQVNGGSGRGPAFDIPYRFRTARDRMTDASARACAELPSQVSRSASMRSLLQRTASKVTPPSSRRSA